MLPPELMGAMGPEMMGGPAGPEPAPGPGSAGGSNLQYLEAALAAVQSYVDGEDDQIHIQTALQCLAKLQSIMAEEQKQSDEMLQGKSSPRALRRATSGQGY